MTRQQIDRSTSLPILGTDDTGCDIIHIDMDAFFASVELRDRPELIGRPVIVGGRNGRGVVTSATYEARAFGVHSAMSMAKAIRLCPNATVIEISHDKYRRASQDVMTVLETFTPQLEIVSIHEAFLNVHSVRRSKGGPLTIAKAIRQTISSELDLPSSAGIGTTTSVAKIASTLAKPNGLMLVPAAQTVEFLHALPVERLWGVGAATRVSLHALGVYKVGELAALPPRALAAGVGKASAQRLTALAAGLEIRSVGTGPADHSISSERTFEVDLQDRGKLIAQLRAESQMVARRMRSAGFVGRTVAVKLRDSDFATSERSHTMSTATASSSALDAVVDGLLDKLWDGRPVRLIGIRVSGLAPIDQVGEQLSFDAVQEARTDAEKTADQITQKFGAGAVKPASTLPPRHLPPRPD